MRRMQSFLLFFMFILNLAGCHRNASETEEIVIQNDFFKVIYNSTTGGIDVYRPDNIIIIRDARTSWNTDTNKVYYSDFKIFTEKSVSDIGNEIGNGRMLTLSFVNDNEHVRIDWFISLYDNLPGIIFETKMTNSGSEQLNLKSIVPLTLAGKTSGFLKWPGAKNCITNGPMYYDPGRLLFFDSTYTKPAFYGETKGGVIFNNELADNPKTIQSWWNVGIFSGYDKEGLSLGYIENKTGLGRIQLLQNAADKFAVVAESVLDPGFILKSSQSISSDRFMVSFGQNPYQTLEEYADLMGKIGHARIGSIVNGWCNWFYTHDTYSEEEILENARFIADNFKKYGLEYIQIDEGYQTWHGDWRGNSRFPHGLKWLATQIRNSGLKPGIWIAPFVVSDTTPLFKEHPDWFLKNSDGSLKRIGPWPGEDTDWFRNEIPKRYGLDITHPEAEKWFTDLIDTLANNWGFEMIKVDFVAWTVFSADHFWDTSATPAQVYSRALSIMRKTAGENCHILDCGPGNITLGSINSMRIEYDQYYGYRNEAWTQYFRGSASSAGAMGKRFFYHNRTWTNDADHVCIDILSNVQAEAAASLISLSGGNMMSGDRLTWLDKDKIEILKKVFPSVGINAKPIDLLDNDPPTSFAVAFSKPFAEWTVAGFFNPNLEHPVEKHFTLDRIWLDTQKTYLLYDFWNEKFLGEIQGDIKITVDPGCVRLMSIHEKKSVPQFISTTRHAMQGAVEIENITFDNASGVLQGVSTAPVGNRFDVIVYVPDGYSWSPVQNKLYDDFRYFTIKMVDNKILRVRLDFADTSRIEWNVCFHKQTKEKK